MQKNETRTFLTPPHTHTENNSKWIKDLKYKARTYKAEENIGSTLFDIYNSQILFDPPPRELEEIKTKINKWDLMKLKSFCTAK